MNYLLTCSGWLPVDDIASLIELSRLAGERFDLVQAGGGNSSVKADDERVYVKASGMALSDVSAQSDFCLLRYRPLLDFVAAEAANKTFSKSDDFSNSDIAALDARAGAAVAAAQLNDRRPSIEALLHCLLGKFTLHTHPIAVAAIVCRSGWREILAREFPAALPVSYRTPGAALALELAARLEQSSWRPGGAEPLIVFLENHGLIVAAASAAEVLETTDDVVGRLTSYISEHAQALDLSRYRLTNSVSRLLAGASSNYVCYLSDDNVLSSALSDNIDLVRALPATPDQLVYCGARPLELPGLDFGDQAVSLLHSYIDEHGQPPKVIIVAGRHLLFAAASLRKCRESEEVLRGHVMLQSAGGDTMQYLSVAEVTYLNNWEAEKYRQSL